MHKHGCRRSSRMCAGSHTTFDPKARAATLDRQVSWLPAALLGGPSHACAQWPCLAVMPVTVAGPLGIFTRFPFHSPLRGAPVSGMKFDLIVTLVPDFGKGNERDEMQPKLIKLLN